jgi:hypothetical protein
MSFNAVNAFVLKFLELNAPDIHNHWKRSFLVSQWDEVSEEFKLLFKKTRKENPEKPKKKKQAGEPKKAKSAYLYFCDLEREKLKVEKPEIKGKDVLKELGARWKLAQDDEEMLLELKEKADADKERYEDEKKNYVPVEKPEIEEEKPKKKTKKHKVEGEPKKAKSAFQFFCVDERLKLKEEKSGLKGKDILVELGARWQLIKGTIKGAKDVRKYEKMAIRDQARYQIEKEDWFKEKWIQDSILAQGVSEQEMSDGDI